MLSLRLPQVTGYTRKFDKNVTMSLRVKDIKAKIKIYAGSVITNSHNKKYQKKKHHVNVYQ